MNEFIYCPNLWDVKLTNKCCIYLRCTIRCFDICIHFEMITTIKLVNIPIISYSYLYLFIFRGSTWDLFVAVQSLSHVWLFATPWTAARQASQSFTISPGLLKLMSIEWVMPSNHLILYHFLLLPSIFPSIRVFSNESALRIRWTKYWSFSISISPSNDYSGLISFRIDWFVLCVVQGALKSLL